MSDRVLSALVSVATGLLGSCVALYIFYRTTKNQRSKELQQSTAAEQQALRSAIDPLFKDLGTLHHLCSKGFDEALKQVDVINEKQRRGEYDLRLTSLPMQVFWQTVNSALTNIRLNAGYSHFQDKNARIFLNSQISLLTQSVQQALMSVRR